MSTNNFNAPRNLASAITTYVSSPVAPAIALIYLFQTHQQQEEEGGEIISFDSQLNELTRSTEQNNTTPQKVEHICDNFGEGEMRTADAKGSVSQQSTIAGGKPKGAIAAAVQDVGQ